MTKEAPQLPKLYIKTISATGTEESQIKTEISTVESEYFEVSLMQLSDGSNYSAQKDIEKPTSIENYKSVSLAVVAQDSNLIKFKSSTEFLHFLSERGYEMSDQVKEKYRTDYTFKRRK